MGYHEYYFVESEIDDETSRNRLINNVIVSLGWDKWKNHTRSYTVTAQFLHSICGVEVFGSGETERRFGVVLPVPPLLEIVLERPVAVVTGSALPETLPTLVVAKLPVDFPLSVFSPVFVVLASI